MRAFVIKPKNSSEFKFVADLLNKLGIGSSFLSSEELEDIGMSKLLRRVNKTRRVSRSSVMKKLTS